MPKFDEGRTLMSAWIETDEDPEDQYNQAVALS